MPGATTSRGKPTKTSISFVYLWKPFHEEPAMGPWLNKQDWKSGNESPFPDNPAKLIRKALNLWFDYRDEASSKIPDGQTGALTDPKTADAIKAFKRDIKNLPDLSGAWNGISFKPSNLKEKDPELDWTTLFVLDKMAAKVDRGENAVWSPDDDVFKRVRWVFDATGTPVQSMEFGLRMYCAFRKWDANPNNPSGKATAPTPYSTDASHTTDPILAQEHSKLNPSYDKDIAEWPDLAKSHPAIPIAQDDQGRPVIAVMGVPWRPTGYSNCCNSQLAAFFVANGGHWVRVKTDKGMRHYALKNSVDSAADFSDQLFSDRDDKGSNAGLGFETRVVGNNIPDSSVGFGLNGCRYLHVGDAIPVFDSAGKKLRYHGERTTDDQVLRCVRIGDWANSSSHHFLIGEVRYGVWYVGGAADGQPPDAYCDQSSFVDDSGNPRPEGVALTTAAPVGTILSDKAIHYLIDKHDEFEHNLAGFLGKDPLPAPKSPAPAPGQWHGNAVRTIRVWQIGVFTANAIWSDPGELLSSTGAQVDKLLKVFANRKQSHLGTHTTYGKFYRFDLTKLEQAIEGVRAAIADKGTWTPLPDSHDAPAIQARHKLPDNWYKAGISNWMRFIRAADDRQDHLGFDAPPQPGISFARFYAPVAPAAK